MDGAEWTEDFEDFAARREYPPGAMLVIVHGVHEIDFVIGVILFAGRCAGGVVSDDKKQLRIGDSNSDRYFFAGINDPTGSV